MQVAFKNRSIDVILAGCDVGEMGAALIGIRPSVTGRNLESQMTLIKPGGFIVAGDTLARDAVVARINSDMESVETWKGSWLETYVTKLIGVGIAASGFSEQFPDLKSCGGTQTCVRLNRNEAC